MNELAMVGNGLLVRRNWSIESRNMTGLDGVCWSPPLPHEVALQLPIAPWKLKKGHSLARADGPTVAFTVTPARALLRLCLLRRFLRCGGVLENPFCHRFANFVRQPGIQAAFQQLLYGIFAALFFRHDAIAIANCLPKPKM
jgi:hypothetical protein